MTFRLLVPLIIAVLVLLAPIHDVSARGETGIDSSRDLTLGHGSDERNEGHGEAHGTLPLIKAATDGPLGPGRLPAVTRLLADVPVSPFEGPPLLQVGPRLTSMPTLVVSDKWGRVVNDVGITLVDWEGQIANPAVTYRIKLPDNSASSDPTTIIITPSDPRIYVNGRLNTSGSYEIRVPQGSNNEVEFNISIFPDRDTLGEIAEISVSHSDEIERIPIQVIDQDVERPLDFEIHVDFSQDRTDFFDSRVRQTVKQVADDWAYFIGDMDLDQVDAGTERTWIWDVDGFQNGKIVTNRDDYTGFLLYAYGVETEELRAGGEPSRFGDNQSSNGVELPLKRSGGIELNHRGNFNELGWIVEPVESEWARATNLGDVPNDLYSIAMHEMGHSLIFHSDHEEFGRFSALGEVRDPEVNAYLGSYPSLDRFFHMPAAVDKASKRGGFGNEYHYDFPRGRWLITKLSLLVAQAIGYSLRDTSPFESLVIRSHGPLYAVADQYYEETLEASGGIPAYRWTVESGALPPGLDLDSFTGTISGQPDVIGDFNFSVRLEDSTEGTLGLARDISLNVVESESEIPSGDNACSSGAAVPDPDDNPGLVSDCAALLASRDTLAGTATLNWSADTPIADWEGVTLRGTPQRVTWLSVSRRELDGQVPPELGSLSALERLYVSDNNLTGTLPGELTGLTSLVNFFFHNNAGLCAPIDDSFQTWLESIGTRHGSSCAPQDSAEDRAVLVQLYNALDGPNWENNANWLSDRPLREWYAVTNDKEGRVDGLYLHGNQLSGQLPAGLAGLDNLRELFFHFNQLTGPIPAELGNLSKLEILRGRNNQLTGSIPIQLGNQTSLDILDLRSNQLTGTIPAELSMLTNLEGLYIGDNRFTGNIPAELGALTKLRGFYVYDNQLTGQIPTELGSMQNMFWLRLDGNQLTGPIPEELGNLTNLEYLYLNDNQLTGLIPSQLAALSNLEHLYLADNQLTGCVPAGLSDVPSNDFDVLNLPFCDCSTGAAVPDPDNNSGLVSDCEALLASGDTLAGAATLNWSADTPIADWDGVSVGGTPQRVTRLYLARSQLTGRIPAELGRLTNLRWLALDGNQLTGPIPSELGDLANLEGLVLLLNKLEGNIPPQLVLQHHSIEG